MTDYSQKGQLELGLQRAREKDRNFHLGGRSFYFFDFDDNIAFLPTPLVVFDKKTGAEHYLTSGEWALYHAQIGYSGPFKDFEIRFDDKSGSFRYFRDHTAEELARLGRQKQIFIDDIEKVMNEPDLHWKGPSWQCFFHAAFNQRPVSLITARGHSPETIRLGIQAFVQRKFLPMEPNYLSLFPVSHVATRQILGDSELQLSTSVLKQRAIRASVQMAIETYGYSPHHRFGMSEDDPKNIQMIVQELTRLKGDFPEMSFFMIETHDGNFVKHEISTSGLSSQSAEHFAQLSLFERNTISP
jgi:hypothetical protein